MPGSGTLPDHPWAFDCREGLIAPDFDMEEVDEVFLKRSIAFLEQHAAKRAGQPFFLLHSTQAVHLPSFPGRAYRGKTQAGPHGDFIHQFDATVGALLDTLDRLGMAGDTLVLVTSDNGPEVGTVLAMRGQYHHDGARPWRGMKRDNWEGGHRIPLIARWPGRTPAGKTSARTVCLTDIPCTRHGIPASRSARARGNTSTTRVPAATPSKPIPPSAPSTSPTRRPTHPASSTTSTKIPAKPPTSSKKCPNAPPPSKPCWTNPAAPAAASRVTANEWHAGNFSP